MNKFVKFGKQNTRERIGRSNRTTRKGQDVSVGVQSAPVSVSNGQYHVHYDKHGQPTVVRSLQSETCPLCTPKLSLDTSTQVKSDSDITGPPTVELHIPTIERGDDVTLPYSEDDQEPSSTKPVISEYNEVAAIRGLYEFSKKVRMFVDGGPQSSRDSRLVHDPIVYVDRIAEELTQMLHLIDDKFKARREKIAASTEPLAKLTRNLETIAQTSIPALRTFLKVGVAGSAVFPHLI
jgi:hypothetical protein